MIDTLWVSRRDKARRQTNTRVNEEGKKDRDFVKFLIIWKTILIQSSIQAC